MLGSLSIEQINDLLKTEMVGRIGMVIDKKVYVVPITYVYHDGYLYSHSHEGQKITGMNENPNVCFEIDRISNLANWQSLIISGVYEELKSEEEILHARKILSDRLRPLLQSETMRPAERLPEPHPHNAGTKNITFRIKILEKSGKYETTY
jgi:nitroimidazol reductase NimA-like FMN-containing flavoprotein (pyridoxamine 5'-phosphate oxidase superfamily)